MGYDVHITRREHWADDEGPAISMEEWRRYVESDADVQPDPQNGDEDFLFVNHPDEPAPLWWSRGGVYTKNPDQPTILKMIEIAVRIRALVQGDDGDFYDSVGKSIAPP